MYYPTINELQQDLAELKYGVIRKGSADRLTIAYHFDDFFEHQIAHWKSLSLLQRQEYLASIDQYITFA